MNHRRSIWFFSIKPYHVSHPLKQILRRYDIYARICRITKHHFAFNHRRFQHNAFQRLQTAQTDGLRYFLSGNDLHFSAVNRRQSRLQVVSQKLFCRIASSAVNSINVSPSWTASRKHPFPQPRQINCSFFISMFLSVKSPLTYSLY